MSLKLEFDTAILRNDMNRLVQATGADAQQLCREEMRMALVEIRKRTAPMRSFGQTEAAGADKKAGEKAVRRDVGRVAVPMELAKIRNPRMRQLIAEGDDEGLQAFFDNVRDAFLRGRRVLKSESELRDAHLRARNRYGRVPKDLRNATFERPFAGYLMKVERAIGKAKAVFNAAAFRVGLRTPEYIARHGPRGDYFEGNSADPYCAAVGSAYIPGYQRIINQAISLRAKKFAAEVARIVDRNGKSRRASLAGTSAGLPSMPRAA